MVAALLEGYNDLPSYRGVMDAEGAGGPADVSLIGSEAEVRAGLAAFADAGTTDFSALEFIVDPADAAPTRELLQAVAAEQHHLMGALHPIAFRTPTSARTSTVDDDGWSTRRTGSPTARTVVSLSDVAWIDLADQIRTPVHLHLAGELAYERGGFDHLAAWDPHLRHDHAGIPIYDPAAVDLRGVDVHRSFTLDDPDDELRSFLQTAGYLHVRDVFGAEAMAAANEEVDRLADPARPGDDRSWWATDADGTDRLCRIVYATLRSSALAALEADPAISRLGGLLGPDLRRAPDRMEGSGVLVKVPGRTKGLANIPWHQDCGMGGHGVFCPNLSIGIQLTGSSAATGNLTVVPGSHGQTPSPTPGSAR